MRNLTSHTACAWRLRGCPHGWTWSEACRHVRKRGRLLFLSHAELRPARRRVGTTGNSLSWSLTPERAPSFVFLVPRNPVRVVKMAEGHLQYSDDAINQSEAKSGVNGAYKRRISVHETDADSFTESGPKLRESDYRQKQV